MKKILILSILFQVVFIQAQNNDAIINTLWGVQEYYCTNEASGIRTDFYLSNSDTNIQDFKGFEYDFKTGDIMNLKVNETLNEDKTWGLLASGDSLSIDSSKYKIVTLNSNEFTVRSSSIQYGIELDYYMKLAPKASLSNEKFNFNQYVEIYPNPTSDFLNLKFDTVVTNNLKEIAIINTTGSYVMTSKLDNSGLQKVSLSNLANGIYFIKIIDKLNTAIAVKKFVVHK